MNVTRRTDQGRLEQIRDEPKRAQLNIKVTPTGKKGFARIARAMGLSQSELIEGIARGGFLLEKAS